MALCITTGSGCTDSGYCAICGAEDVNYAYSDHLVHMTDFDTNYCYYSCDCGEFAYEVWHSVYCDSIDKNTCVECGKNTESDGIKIGDLWHRTEAGYDENYCWTVCTACGYVPYFNEHYTGCCDPDETRCDNCGRMEEDGVKIVWEHTALGHETFEEDGILMHRQICWECGYEGANHEIDQNLTCHSVNGDMNNHEIFCSGCEFKWKDTHTAECGDNTCVDCGAENVNISMHINHPEDSKVCVYNDMEGHRS